MTAVTDARNTKTRDGRSFELTVKTGETIYQGTLCVLDTNGELVAAVPGTSFVGGYIATKTVTSAPAGTQLKVESNMVAKFANGDSITATSIGDAAYGFDNATVKKTATGLSVVGYIEQVDSDGVWVRLMPVIVSGLAAANNLSDVGSVDIARLNLKANRLIMTVCDGAALDGTATERAVYAVTEDGTVKKLYSVIDGALATGDATLTGKIGGVAITNGAITITQAGSAAGDVDSATPTAANVISQGGTLEVTVGGTNSAARKARVTAEIWT